MPTLFIGTVGGSPEALVASLKYQRPDGMVFVASRESKALVGQQIIPGLESGGVRISAAQFDVTEVQDPEDLQECVEQIRELDTRVLRWCERGPDHAVAVDYTGGTKCMSAALALVARRWPCEFWYVGGDQRTKGGVGVVVSGSERILHSQNPWDALGYQVTEEAIILFDEGGYDAAASTLARALPNVRSERVKAELTALRLLCEAYRSWDLFQHRDARQKLRDLEKKANDLKAIFSAHGGGLLRLIRSHYDFLSRFQANIQGDHLVVDLLGNARRCGTRGKFDDAVARLYRAVEAAAQLQLARAHGVSTDRVPLDRIPTPLRERLAIRAPDGAVKLGLQDAYELLDVYGDPLGKRFTELGLGGGESPLGQRNNSILAHGFVPVKEAGFSALWKATLSLTGTGEEQLPEFPKLEVNRVSARG